MKLVILAAIVAISAAYHGPDTPIHLDRLDKNAENCPWNPTLGSYHPKVNVVNDAGIYIVGHGLDEFHDNFQVPGGGRIADVMWDFETPNLGVDTNGLGTAIAGAAGGYYTGVGQNITLEGIRVTADGDYQNIDIKNFEDGLLQVIIDYKDLKANDPIGYRRGVVLISPFLDTANADTTGIQSLITDMVTEGLVVVGPAGDSEDAILQDCAQYCPGNMDISGLITVGNSLNSNLRHLNSIPGTCNEIYAPGSNVYSSYYDFEGDVNNHDMYVQGNPGSQFAAALVAGAAAMVRSTCPDYTPAQIEQAILDFTASKDDQIRDPVTGAFLGYMLRYPNRNDPYEFCPDLTTAAPPVTTAAPPATTAKAPTTTKAPVT